MVTFVGFGHGYYRCRCGQAAFGLVTYAPDPVGSLVTLYACTPDELTQIEAERQLNTLEILRRLGYR